MGSLAVDGGDRFSDLNLTFVIADDVLVADVLDPLGEGHSQHLRWHAVDADAVELRVLGCLIEKQQTTPDAYPLSLNALRLACNQSTNRDPVADYDEPTIRTALERLSRRGWVRLASGRGSRAVKYRHLADEALDVSDAELSVLGMLMLRGPQTSGELKQRADRLYHFASPADVEVVLDGLIRRELAVRLARRPGEKGERYAQLLGVEDGETPKTGDSLEARVERLEAEVRELREALQGS